MKASEKKIVLEISQMRAIERGERFLVVGLDDNFQWLEKEVDSFLAQWAKGLDLEDIAENLGRPLHEVTYLVAYLDGPKSRNDTQELYVEKKFLFKRRRSGYMDTYTYTNRSVASV